MSIEKIRKLKQEVSKIALEKIEKDQISINDDILDSLKNSPTIISMDVLEDICVSIGIDISVIANILEIEIETKADKLRKQKKLEERLAINQKKSEERLAMIKTLTDENKELIITLVEDLRKEEDDYRGIDDERINYFLAVSKEGVDEKQLKGLLEKETEWEREYYDDDCKKKIKKLKKIKKNTFEFWQEATDDHGEFTYTYTLIESKKISSERLAELINPSFLFHLDAPKLISISHDLYRKLFFNLSRLGKAVIPVINGIGKEEFDSLVVWLKKELKF